MRKLWLSIFERLLPIKIQGILSLLLFFHDLFDIRFIIKFKYVTPKNGNEWESEIRISFKSFIRWFVNSDIHSFSYTKFRDNRGFNKC